MTWDAGTKHDYAFHGTGQGVYAFVLEGAIELDGKSLARRDGMGVWQTGSISITAAEDARFLLMEVPMQW